jgi:hypothetical protein
LARHRDAQDEQTAHASLREPSGDAGGPASVTLTIKMHSTSDRNSRVSLPGQARLHRISATAIGLVLMVGCAAPPAPATSDLPAVEERLRKLEDRVTTLERLLTALPSPPMRSRAEIVKNIQSLEQKRADLLRRYTPAHPEVREIDLSLRLLRVQLDFLDQANRLPQ